MSDYDFPKWEFEQEFNANTTSTPLLTGTTKERGIWRVIGVPEYGMTYTNSLGSSVTTTKSGKVEIWKNITGTWTLVREITNLYVLGDIQWMTEDDVVSGPQTDADRRLYEPVSNDQLGMFVYLPYYGDDSVPVIVCGTKTNTFAITVDTGTTSNGDWATMSAYQVWDLRRGAYDAPYNKGSATAFTQQIDMPEGIAYSNRFFQIPKYIHNPLDYPVEYYNNNVTIQTLTPMTAKKSVCMAWDGGYAWAFMASTTYTGYRYLSITRIDPWHYSGTDDLATNEKLTYHYWFDNHTTLSDPTVGTFNGLVAAPSVDGLSNGSVTIWYDTFYYTPSDSIIYGINFEKLSATLCIETPTITTGISHQCGGDEDVTEKQSILSNVCVAEGNLFFTSRQITDSEQQRLWRYDLSAKTWSYTILPGRQQARPRHIVDGLDGSIWITNYNNHSVIRADAKTGAILATIRASRHPYQLVTNQSKEVFIASDSDNKSTVRKFYADSAKGNTSNSAGGITGTDVAGFKVIVTTEVTNGQISIINQSTNGVDAFCAGTCKSMDLTRWPDGSFFDDGRGHLWFMDENSFGRLIKSDLSMKLMYPTPVDAEVDAKTDDSPGGWKDSNGNKYTSADLKDMIPGNATIDHGYANCLSSIVTPAFTYERWNGAGLETTYVKPYVIWTTNGTSFKIVRASALVSKPKYKHRGTAMIATGAQAYIGDGNL